MKKKIISGVLLCTMVFYTMPVMAVTKDETVYSKIDASGSSYSTIVSSHTQDENGSDKYDQEKSEKELPIECNVKYELDGKEIDANELVGKSGKVKITIEYKNKDAHTVKVNGKDETLYTPFVVICGTILDNEHHKNIEITNGKVIDDGSKTTVIGISLPGMQESLGIEKDKLEIPNKVEITMDSTEFELTNIVTFATPKIVEEKDLEIFDKVDEIYSQVDTLQSSSRQLEEGANTLKTGIDTYTEKSKEFNNAMNKVAEGTETINSNYNKIDNGISSLNSGSAELKNGAEQLNNGIETLSTNLGSLPQGISALYQGSKDLSNGMEGLAAGVNTLKGGLTQTTTTAITELTKNNAILQKTIDALGEEQPELVATLKAQKAENEQVIKALTPTQETNSQMQALENGMQAVKTGTKSLEENLGKVNQAAGALPEAIAKIQNGSKAVANGSKTLNSGAVTLNNGSKALKNGIQTLDTSTQKLLDANNQLTEGTSTISNGMDTLAAGITKFNREGIDKICNYINGDLKNITNRVQKLQELSEQYEGFNEDSSENSKFIMIMDSIKKDKENKQEIILENKNNEDKKD